MTVAQLLATISSRELSEWMAFAELEPWGEERADLRAGIVASTMANTVRDPKKRREPFDAQDFMPRFGESANERSGESADGESADDDDRAMLQRARIEALNAAFGGKDLRKRP